MPQTTIKMKLNQLLLFAKEGSKQGEKDKNFKQDVRIICQHEMGSFRLILIVLYIKFHKY